MVQDVITKLLDSIRDMERDLEAELDRRRSKWKFKLVAKRILFENGVVQSHRRFKTGLIRFLREARFSAVLTSPFIYSLIVPLALLDVFVFVFQRICFPAYGIPPVPRSDFIAIDRHRLAYLNVVEKMNCLYCEYANGLIAYVREVAGRTEEHWCPIKHARKIRNPHQRYFRFLDYGDAQGYRSLQDKRRNGSAGD